MKRLRKVAVALLLALVMVVSVVSTAFAANAKSGSVRVGVGKGDITGPITDISTGYNSLGDLMKGLLTRLNARAFIVETNGEPQVYVSAELVHMTESIKPGVLKELAKRGLTQYNEQNTMLAATHCHSSTSNTSWYALYDLINGVPGYDDESYQVICIGIADAIEEATNDLAPGSVTLSYGDTSINTYNRSLLAARANKNYKTSAKNDTQESWQSVSKEMSLLTFKHDGEGDIGMLSFFPSHGTSNGITNELVAADHKGYAAYYVEQAKGKDYVAAFAQAETGDVSPNEPNKKDVTKAFKRPADVDKTLDVINATYSNAYSQYMVTREEFAEQHYEGSTDLFGPWSGAALTQEFDRLAQDMVGGRASKSTAVIRTSAPAALLYTYAAAVPTPVDVNDSGKLVEDVKSSYKRGETVTAVFEAANPRSISDLRIAGNKDLVPDDHTYMKVQKLVNGKWKTVATDNDPYTYTRYHNHVDTYRVNVNWLTKKAAKGTYRLVYYGVKKDTLISYHKVVGKTSAFTLT